MTVLVGVLCQDGVVVGSDSSATIATASQLSTIELPGRQDALPGRRRQKRLHLGRREGTGRLGLDEAP
jgi:hypothetical protein